MEHELCTMCKDYEKNKKCKNKDTCKLLKIINENKSLKNENSKLKLNMSYMINPNTIGEKNDMGW